MHPACPNKKPNHLQNSFLRRTQFWVRKTFSKPASLKRASLVYLPMGYMLVHRNRGTKIDFEHAQTQAHPGDFFFSSSLADVALWLGPYMSISSQNVIRTKTKKVRNCRQITTNQKTHKPARRPANPPARFAFRQNEKQQTRHTKGARAQTKTPTKRICQGTQWSDHCVTLKNMPKNELSTTTFSETWESKHCACLR